MSDAPRIASLDLSLTATGLVDPDGLLRIIKTKPKDWEMEHGDSRRLRYIVNEITIVTTGADLFVIEGFSFGSKGSALFQTAGLGYLMRDQLLADEIPFVLVPPSSLKKYITGKGTADKPTMRMETFKRFERDISDDNVCDAFGLRAMALDHYGHPLVKMPEVNRSALDAVEWPAL